MVMEGSYRDARFGSQGIAEYARGDVDGHCATDEASAAAIAAAQSESRALTGEEQTLVATAKRSALRFPDTQQQLANAHSALDSGVGAAHYYSFCCGYISREPLTTGMSSGQTDGTTPHFVATAGPRWLTTEYCMGDILILSIFTLHSSSDNLSREIRLR